MAELTNQEKLQPSLLDRLTDDDPEQKQEPRSRRVLSIQRLRESVLRDLAWLLNTTTLRITGLQAKYPQVARSVINYGLPDFAGATGTSVNAEEMEAMVRQAIWDFEPRILRGTLKVRVQSHESQMNHNCLTFQIEGELWAQPVPLELYLKTELDLETGSISIADYVR